MKSLSQYIMEALGVRIPSCKVRAMMGMLKCKSEDEVRSFLENNHLYDNYVKRVGIENIFHSIQTINKDCDYWTVGSDIDMLDGYTTGELIRDDIEINLDMKNAACWVIYMTENDTDMLILCGKNRFAEKTLKEFVGNCNDGVYLIYSWGHKK